MAADVHHPTTAHSGAAPHVINAELAADRAQFWNRFCRFLVWVVAATAATLALMAIFLV